MQEQVTRRLTFGDDVQVVVTVEAERGYFYIAKVVLSFVSSVGAQYDIALPLRSARAVDALSVLVKAYETIEQAIGWLTGSGLIELEEEGIDERENCVRG